jgi:hypothetical protein
MLCFCRIGPCCLQREDIEECVTEYARIALWTVERDQLGQPVLHLQVSGKQIVCVALPDSK